MCHYHRALSKCVSLCEEYYNPIRMPIITLKSIFSLAYSRLNSNFSFATQIINIFLWGKDTFSINSSKLKFRMWVLKIKYEYKYKYIIMFAISNSIFPEAGTE